VHTIIPDQQEWLSVLSCINAAGECIPHFYIFKGKRMRRNYIEKCEENATMAMQAKAWMTGHLFSSWILHFVKSLESRGGISPTNRHLLILDGHGSHVTLDVVHKASQTGLDVLTLPSHTSHRLQPLDVSIFRPFKCAFRGYRDAWILQNRGRATQKEDLAQWVSLALKRALTPLNIIKGFKGTGIWPYNPDAVSTKMGPSKQFHKHDSHVSSAEIHPQIPAVVFPGVPDLVEDISNTKFYNLAASDDDSSDEEEGDGCNSGHNSEDEHDRPLPADDVGLQQIRGQRIADSQSQAPQYFVVPDPSTTDGASSGSDCDAPPANPPAEDATEPSPSLRRFLQLPEVVEPAQR
jgi:hypothetical protein